MNTTAYGYDTPLDDLQVLDPSSAFSNVKDIRQERADEAKERRVKEQTENENRKMRTNPKKTNRVLNSTIKYGVRFGIAGISSLAITMFVYYLNPPITQAKNRNPYTTEKQDPKKVLILNIIVIAGIMLIPEFYYASKMLHRMLTHNRTKKK